MKQLTVGLVLDDTLDTPDGVQQYVLNVGEWLKAQGHDVHYLVGETERTDLGHTHSLSRNVKVRFNANRMSMPLPVSRSRLKSFLAEHKFDVLHVQVPYSPFMAGRLLRLVPDETAVVGTFHILPYSRLTRGANSLLSKINSRTKQRFDELVAVSVPAAKFAENTYGFKNVAVVPNPVKLAQFAGAKSTSQKTNIVFLGRLEPRKGALQLVRAVARLKRTSPREFRVLIGGKGNLLPKLGDYAKQHHLEDIVELEGFIAEADKAAFLAQADIAVFPSLGGESFGIVLLEAMATARGVVLAGDNPGYRSVMTPLAEKQLFGPKNTAEFAETLGYWLEHPETRMQAAEKQSTYVQQFDINVVGKQLESVYGQALQKRHLMRY